MDGQATEAPISEDALAQFLIDNPDADRADDTEDPVAPADLSPEQDNDEAEDQDVDPDAGDEPEDEPDPKSQRKFKVTVKGEDGADLEQEVDEKELVAGYQRHADYTRKTQELARREDQALETVKAKISEAQTYFVQQTQAAQAAVMRLAGLQSPEEMAVLARTDPAAYAAEKSRADQIHAVMNEMHARAQHAQMQQQQMQQQEMQKAFSHCWGVLGQKGIDKPKLQHIFETVAKDYGVPNERFANLADPALVLIMKDAVAYRELLKKKPEVTKKAEASPRLPQKQSAPRSETVNKRVTDRLRSGKASREDLASFILANNL